MISSSFPRLAFVACALFGVVRAEDARPFTVEQAVALALEKNFELKIQRNTTSSSKDALDVAKSDFDPSFTLSATKSYAAQQVAYDSQSVVDTRLGVSQRIATGATITASGSLDRSHTVPVAVSSLDPLYNSTVTLQVSQPLLKNAGSSVALAQIEKAKLGVSKANYDLQSSVLSIVRSVEAGFYSLVFAREQREVRAFSLGVAQQLLDEAQTRLKTGVATDIDVLQAEVSLANARRALLISEQQVKNAEDNLTALIKPEEFDSLPGNPVFPEVGDVKVDFDHSYKLARDHSPDVASSNLVTAQSKIDLDVARRNRLPELDVNAGLGYNARESSASRAASRVIGNDSYDWQVGASLTIPWGQRGDKARYRSAQSSLASAQLRTQLIEQSLTVDVRTAIRAVQTSLESVKITALATELSRKQYELEKARYDAGVSTFRRVQEVKEDWDTAKINELQANVDLRNALGDLSRLEASSLAHYHIALE